MKKILIIGFFINSLIADYATDIQPIFDQNCNGCHSYPNSLILTSYDSVINSGTVVPGDASSSSLYDRITRPESAPGDMPPSGSLSSSEISLIETWINNGANETDAVAGCTDLNAITCDDNVDTLYFPECSSCAEGVACDNYYNPNAIVDNGACMYNDVPSDQEFQITLSDSGCGLDWSAFTPPVSVEQYVLQRCLDPDGDTDGDGEYEYENCTMIIAPGSNFLGTDYYDNFDTVNAHFKYTFYVHYPNNNYWGSAFNIYYYDDTSQCVSGDLNEDGLINVQDIISLVNAILSPGSLSDICAADLNGDGNLNVQDIVGLVNLILSL